MRSAGIIVCVFAILGFYALAEGVSSQVPARNKRTVIAASVVLDGKGHALHDTRIVVEGSQIVALDPKARPVDYDLRGITVLPGWIDAHVHITWSFGPDGRNAGQGGTSQEAAYAAASNAWLTLMAGFTTLQSVGSPPHVPLRHATPQSPLPRPRIPTTAPTLSGPREQTRTPRGI